MASIIQYQAHSTVMRDNQILQEVRLLNKDRYEVKKINSIRTQIKQSFINIM